MGKRIRKFGRATEHTQYGHRFEHWYVDNQVYFITGRSAEGRAVFADEQAKRVFWDRFAHYTEQAGFEPWVTSLLDNHYHTLGYLERGEALKRMMQRLHGSVAKLVNDLLDLRARPFWAEHRNCTYFDGCIRDDQQFRRAYRYTLRQAERHGVVRDYREYAHTIVRVGLDEGAERARTLGALMEGVPYPRYMRGRGPRRRPA